MRVVACFGVDPVARKRKHRNVGEQIVQKNLASRQGQERQRECQVFCVRLIGFMLPERSKDDDNIERTAGRVAEGLQAA